MWGLHAINASSAWDASTGAGIVVVVVDSGIDYNHPEISANVVPGWDFVGANVGSPQQGNDPIDRGAADLRRFVLARLRSLQRLPSTVRMFFLTPHTQYATL